MLALRVDYLAGRAVATAWNDRGSAEWPPHPSRLYAALVDAWADVDAPDPAEEAALRWLEAQGPPAVHASEATKRSVMTVYVPVNDPSVASGQVERKRALLAEAERAFGEASAALVEGLAAAERRRVEKDLARVQKGLDKARRDLVEVVAQDRLPAAPNKEQMKMAVAVMPESRLKQSRTFPSVTPKDPTVWMAWATDPGEHREPLQRLASRVFRLGHSSSVVRATVLDDVPADAPEAEEPMAEGERVLRVVDAGQLDRLVEEHGRHRGVEPRVLPARSQPYGRRIPKTDRREPHSVFDDRTWVVLTRERGDRLDVTAGVALARAVRGALLRHAAEPIASVLTGHRASGEPLDVPHLAVVPLPFVGHLHADGGIRGVALILPREASPRERGAVLQALEAWERAAESPDEGGAPLLRAVMGSAGALNLRRLGFEEVPSTLRPGTWCQPRTRWVTATPVALDRNPGDLQDPDPRRRAAAWAAVAQDLRRACAHVGLPEPVEVEGITSVPLAGTAKARDWPAFPPQPGRQRKVKVHARLVFAEPVRGPILLGSGRYLGLGLFRPVREDPDHA